MRLSYFGMGPLVFADARFEDAAYSVLSQTLIPSPENAVPEDWIFNGRHRSAHLWHSHRSRFPLNHPGLTWNSDNSLYGSLRRDAYKDCSDSDDESVGSHLEGSPMVLDMQRSSLTLREPLKKIHLMERA
jgi:hypothetical protein